MAINKTCDQCKEEIDEGYERKTPQFTLARFPSIGEHKPRIEKGTGFFKKPIIPETRGFESYDLCSIECLEDFVEQGRHK